MVRSRRRKPVTRTRVSTNTTLRVSGADASGTRIVEAAGKIADGIKERSAAFSKKIPPSVHVGSGTSYTATVYASAPNAYPIETGARHPLFATGPKRFGEGAGGWNYWYPMKQIRFMEEGAAMALDDAAATYGKVIDDWLKEVGW